MASLRQHRGTGRCVQVGPSWPGSGWSWIWSLESSCLHQSSGAQFCGMEQGGVGGWEETGGAGLGLVLSRLCSSLCFPANTQPWTLAASLNLWETEAKREGKMKCMSPGSPLTPPAPRPSTMAYCLLGFQLVGDGRPGVGPVPHLQFPKHMEGQ